MKTNGSTFLRIAMTSLAASAIVPVIAIDQGTTLKIPYWYMLSSFDAGNDVATLSAADLDISKWHRVGSRSTLMAGLIEAGVHNDTDLFFANTLENVDSSQFRKPWYYRHTFALPSLHGHYFLHPNGITSKADIYVNAREVANNTIQAGAYNGPWYNITEHVQEGDNALLIKVYPTDYNNDFALGFVDWNPYPPDNGTGIWRDFQIKHSGPVIAKAVRVVTDFANPSTDTVKVSFKSELCNFEDLPVQVNVDLSLWGPEGERSETLSAIFDLDAHETKSISLSSVIKDPQIWWPRAWGSQPLYTVNGTVCTSDGAVADDVSSRTFGVRNITSHINEHNDRVFAINGLPFQVLGAGYAPDMFLRFDEDKVRTQFQHMLDMGLNTVRLEGKQEHPELYDIADELGLMVLAGWECCDKWEAWSYNEDVAATKWNDNDYTIAGASMAHEAYMMQSHPSTLGFLVGSDYWPDDRAAQTYVGVLKALDWQNPIVASASSRGYPDILGPSGMKMEGPYDWVSPNYWWHEQLGGAFGFGSELGAGVGTPEVNSLRKFLSVADLEDLWTQPSKGLYHMSTNVSQFHDRAIYDEGLSRRYGEPTSLEDYLFKAQMMDYEATRAQFEAYSALWNAGRPATGMIYWMLNNAWPSLHWNLFDYYLHPAGSYYGAKIGGRIEHVVYSPINRTLYLINHSLDRSGDRKVTVELINLKGQLLYNDTIGSIDSVPNTSKQIDGAPDVSLITDMALLKLVLHDAQSGTVISRNVYWLSSRTDSLDWDNSTWYHTPVTSFADFTALKDMSSGDVDVQITTVEAIHSRGGYSRMNIKLRETSNVPAVFISLNLVGQQGQDITPVFWSDNYVTLWPKEELMLYVEYPTTSSPAGIQISGKGIADTKLVTLGALRPLVQHQNTLDLVVTTTCSAPIVAVA